MLYLPNNDPRTTSHLIVAIGKSDRYHVLNDSADTKPAFFMVGTVFHIKCDNAMRLIKSILRLKGFMETIVRLTEKESTLWMVNDIQY